MVCYNVKYTIFNVSFVYLFLILVQYHIFVVKFKKHQQLSIAALNVKLVSQKCKFKGRMVVSICCKISYSAVNIVLVFVSKFSHTFRQNKLFGGKVFQKFKIDNYLKNHKFLNPHRCH